ncbi:MAG TPA: MEDS domain-containing protein [Gemmatimonadales bacterium]|nr:MEDS domain-containing protein [Gemmatimonadales bacterium]
MTQGHPAGTIDSDRHVVQCHGEDTRSLIANVARFLEAGFQQGEGLLLIGTRARNESLLQQLGHHGVDVAAALQQARLVVLDAETTLERILVDSRPDRDRFDAVVGGVVRRMHGQRPGAAVRAYGEMVGVLWKAWHFAATIQLEEHWNGLLAQERVRLFCGYPIDVFGLEFDAAMIHGVLCAHSRLMPAVERLDQAIERAMDEVLGPEAAFHRAQITADQRWGIVPRAEAAVLWLRHNLPQHAPAILDRAREYCEPMAA